MTKLNPNELIEKIAQETKEHHYTKEEAQTKIDANHKLNSDYVSDSGNNKFVNHIILNERDFPIFDGGSNYYVRNHGELDNVNEFSIISIWNNEDGSGDYNNFICDYKYYDDAEPVKQYRFVDAFQGYVYVHIDANSKYITKIHQLPEDNLNSTSKISPLSANQGRILNQNKQNKITTTNKLSSNLVDTSGDAKFLNVIELSYDDYPIKNQSPNYYDFPIEIFQKLTPNTVIKFSGEEVNHDVVDIYYCTKKDIDTDDGEITFTFTSDNGYYFLIDYGDEVRIYKRYKSDTPIDNLTSTSTYSPLSANQGRVLKGLLDETNSLLNEKQDNLVTGKGIDISEDYDFVNMQWNGLNNFNGNNIWTDGNKTYYSEGTNQYVLDEETNTWSAKVWNGLTNFNGIDVWTDTVGIYYSAGTTQYVLNKTTSTWSTMVWDGLIDFDGRSIWEADGIYYFTNWNNTSIFMHPVGTTSWSSYGDPNYPAYYEPECVWKDSNGNIYCSTGPYQYKFDNTSSIVGQWGISIIVPRYTNIYGYKIWKFGDTIYASNGNDQYVYDETANVWNPVTNTTFKGIDGIYVWNLGDKVYYSKGQTQLILKNKNELIEVNYNDTQEKLTMGYGITLEGDNSINVDTNTFQNKLSSGNGIKLTVKPLFKEFTFGGIDNTIEGQYIWSDGENIHHLNTWYTYELDKATSTWKSKLWYGLRVLENLKGYYIWSDGTNIYYSNDTTQYKIDIETSTWTTMTWSGFNPYGNKIWTDGTNIYYSGDFGQYVLNGTTWTTKTWNGLPGFDGESIWKDGENIYLSMNSLQYVLDVETSTWSEKTWNGLTEFGGYNVWKDGDNNIYYSDGYNHNYILDRETSTWSEIDLGIQGVTGENVWSDGTNTYYSNGTKNYKLLNLNDKVEVDTNVIQEKLTAGTGITISDENVISASGGELPHLYKHNITLNILLKWNDTLGQFRCQYMDGTIISTKSTAYTVKNLLDDNLINDIINPNHTFIGVQNTNLKAIMGLHYLSYTDNTAYGRYTYMVLDTTDMSISYGEQMGIRPNMFFIAQQEITDTVTQIF